MHRFIQNLNPFVEGASHHSNHIQCGESCFIYSAIIVVISLGSCGQLKSYCIYFLSTLVSMIGYTSTTRQHARMQLKMFTTKKCISQHEFTSLLELLHLHAPSLVKLITTIAKEVNKADTAVSCCKHWINLLQALSSASPVCALVPPTEEVHKMLKEMESSGSLKSNAKKMAFLQKEAPVLFTLIECLPSYPTEALQPILKRLVELSLAPFTQDFTESSTGDHTDINDDDMISYFPKLPSLRKRKIYKADSSKSSVCTKKSSRHPSLLPGIFTLYCQHGNAACMIIIIITPLPYY